MINYYRTDEGVIQKLKDYDEGAWVQLTNPSPEECVEIADRFQMDVADVRAALDDEESSRISLEEGYTLILVDIPTAEIRNNRNSYQTIPLGILLREDVVITVCTEETAVLQTFVDQSMKEFSTKKRMRFVYQILYNSNIVYQSLLRTIDRKRKEIEERINGSTGESDLFDLHELESNLVYFATSLRANSMVLDRLTRYGRLQQFPEDRDLLEDVIIENRQAIEMTGIYRDIINDRLRNLWHERGRSVDASCPCASRLWNHHTDHPGYFCPDCLAPAPQEDAVKRPLAPQGRIRPLEETGRPTS